MRRAQGCLIITDPNAAQPLEHDTFTCAHCNTVVMVKFDTNLADLGGNCRLCMKLVCRNCVGKGCEPFEKKLEKMEAQDKFRRSLGI